MKKKIYIIAGVALLAVIVLLAAILINNNDDPAAEVIVHEENGTQVLNETPAQSESAKTPELRLNAHTEKGDIVEIDTTYCTLSFPFAYSDLVEEELVDNSERTAIDFYAVLGNERYPIYTVSFCAEGDIVLGTLQLDGWDCEVRASIAAEATGLEGDDMISFHAAQETFNDIWNSLVANENFTPAQ